MVRLAVAAADVRLRPPAGVDDLLLLESGQPGLRVALALLGRLVERADGTPLDCNALPIPDVDRLLLSLRQSLVGDRLQADTRCVAPECGARVDISFSIADYLAHHVPADDEALAPGSEDGWYVLQQAGVELRVPRADDQLAVEGLVDPVSALLARCVRPRGPRESSERSDPSERSEQARAQVEAALERLAPSLFAELEATCPECGLAMTIDFDPLSFTLGELRDRAAWIYEDVAWIAHYFHWNEAEILALPAARRARYAELAAAHARRGQ